MTTLFQDIRYGIRTLLKKPLMTIIAVLTLALGIGANTAMFSLMDQLLVVTFAYRDLDTLVIVQEKNLEKDQIRLGISPPNFRDFIEQNTVFTGMGTFRGQQFLLDTGDEVLPLFGQRTTTNMFSILGVPPMMGRLFREDEGQRGSDNVVILSEGLWKRQFGSDPDISGKTLKLNTRLYTVIGVMPSGFWRQSEVWVPMVFTDEEMSASSRAARNLRVWARLRPGVSVEQAEAQMETIAGRLAQQYPDTNKGWGIHLLRPRELTAQQLNISGLIFFAPVVFVLLIACANVAHLQLARTLERRREVALRTALGAGRFRIMRQLLTESALLAALGGGLGLVVAYAAIRGLMNYMPQEWTRSIGGLELDAQALVFMLAVAGMSGLLFGLAPALQVSKIDLNHTLKEGGARGSVGTGGKRFRQALLVSEIALATMLLAGAGLMLSMAGGAAHEDLGFNPKNLLTMSTSLQAARFREPEARRNFGDLALKEVRSLPGVRSATLAAGLPLFSSSSRRLTRLGDDPAVARQQNVSYRPADSNYFQTMEIPLRMGRLFTEQDIEGSQPVVIVNETLVREYFPDKNPVGESIILEEPAGPALDANAEFRRSKEAIPRVIVGVVGDVKQQPVDIFPQPAIAYVPYRQDPSVFVVLAIRSDSNPASMTSAVVDRILPLAPDQRILAVETMEKRINDQVKGSRFLPLLLSLFAVLGLALAGVGTYGTTSYSVAQRTQEFGIRMALGAQTRNVVRMVVNQGLKLAALGFVVGAAGAYALIKILISLIPPSINSQPELISTMEIVLTGAATVVVLTAVALLANYVPARRATRIDPMAALRYE